MIYQIFLKIFLVKIFHIQYYSKILQKHHQIQLIQTEHFKYFFFFQFKAHVV